MGTKFCEDPVSLSDLKVDPGRVVKQALDTHRPELVTSHGRSVAVVQSVTDDERTEEERIFMRAVVAGLADLEAGREVSLADAKARLGFKSPNAGSLHSIRRCRGRGSGSAQDLVCGPGCA